MRVSRLLDAIQPDARGSSVSIGNFDGVHQGHKQLLRRNLALAWAGGYTPSVLTFDPHPTHVVAPERAPKLISTMQQRLELIAAEGIEQTFVLPFDRAFASMDPEEFVRHVLVDGIGARAVLVGDNFRFGAKQAGNVATLLELGERFGFHTEVVPCVRVRGRVASSTAVRQLITSGQVSAACRMLGRPYALEGRVVSGFGIGSKQTVPTLNLDTAAEVLPANGVYITRTHDLDDASRVWPSITNVGMRPTFNGESLTIETFLLAPLNDPVPTRIRVELLRFVRQERRFNSPDELKQQIFRDVGRANAYFRRVTRLG